MNFQLLSTLIKSNGFTQQEFSAKIGIDNSVLSRVLSGEHRGTFALLAKIIEVLDLNPLIAYELLLNRKYEKPIPELVPDAVSLIKELQADIADLKRDRDRVFKWVEGFGKS